MSAAFLFQSLIVIFVVSEKLLFSFLNILSFEFKMHEKDILAYTNLTSVSSINYGKRNCYALYHSQDPVFLANVKDLMEKYPYDFSGASVKIKQKPQLVLSPIYHASSVQTVETLRPSRRAKSELLQGYG